ncbi:uncharacterized protein LOC124163358 isoform X1 [Ischnura elegans]|uniref:uncharacterized protein LOC124163358 isoform X1 n=1 Tax=Ischnura elegans TaxID=197161 RepID=UPI001ED882CD|nr:uncharacterized protein LOC124163358 isoform X1 [Ischnura elegans]XP_046396172.1 uncharacterized protein LOC124163358 isoform X1 [Ischnura elegans]XP_046396173.1 uncharacterized protein LOC124163358 isoform X1 [Ischnura elegans]XP_046396174.1 uncharacterized protein LOC124163358 isoform X1 [Ischnura elegans]
MIDARILILAVKERPCLWHYSDSDYMNKELREKAWEEVAKTVLPEWDQRTDKFDVCNDIKRKWANIRDSYRKEYHRSRRGADGQPGEEADGRPRKREYIFSDMLTFLKPVLKRRNRPSNYMANFLRSGGDTVAESTEDDAATTEDSCQSQSSSIPCKRTRTDPGVSTSSAPVVWIRSIQEHTSPQATTNPSMLSQQRATEGMNVVTRRPGRPRLSENRQSHPIREAPTSTASTVSGSGIGAMSPPSAPATVHPQAHNPQPFHHIQQSPPYQQLHPNYQNAQNVGYIREQDPDLSFLVSFLPDMRTMSELQKMDFKIGMMNLMKSIKFPYSGPSSSRVQVTRLSSHSGGQEFGQSSRQGIVYVTPDTHHEFEEENEVCGSELPTVVKSEINDA